MKRFLTFILTLTLAGLLSACGGESKSSDNATSSSEPPVVSPEAVSSITTGSSATAEPTSNQPETSSETVSEIIPEITEETQMQLNIEVNGHLLTAELADNSSTKALLELLANGPITIDMHDYANMEKVGALPQSLPRNDEQINTEAGDLILYQGDQFVIYYDTNSWSLTRLGKITNASENELREILGSGNVTATLFN